jgi:hypothetical protein
MFQPRRKTHSLSGIEYFRLAFISVRLHRHCTGWLLWIARCSPFLVQSVKLIVIVLRLNYCSRCLYYSSISIECYSRNDLQKSKDIKGPRKDDSEDVQQNRKHVSLHCYCCTYLGLPLWSRSSRRHPVLLWRLHLLHTIVRRFLLHGCKRNYAGERKCLHYRRFQCHCHRLSKLLHR